MGKKNGECIKDGCHEHMTIGKLLCEEHTKEWQKIWNKFGNDRWEAYIHGKIGHEKVEFT